MDSPTVPTTDVKIRVLLKERNTEAYVQVTPARPILPEKLREALAEAGVVVGIDERALLEAAASPDEDLPDKVAQGRLPVNGEPASIEYRFRTDAAATLVEDASGRVDYREQGRVASVTAGQTLAVKTPATEGAEGLAVTGEAIPPKPGKDLPLTAGQNVMVSEDGLTLTALIDGQPKLEGSRVSVLPLITIGGSVDFNTGNITFKGSVRVAGDVMPGFTVKATQDVDVDGVVEGATIEAGGTVTVRGGVRKHTVITAHGDIRVRYVDSESSLTTRGRIVVAEAAMNSTMTAGLTIRVGRQLIGGKAQAGASIQAGVIGAPSGVHTTVDVRASRQAKVLEQLEKAIATLTNQLDTVERTLEQVQNNPAAPKEAVGKTLEIKHQLESRLEQLRLERDQRLEDGEASVRKPPFVTAAEGIHPGVAIYFDDLVYNVEDTLNVPRVAVVNGQLSFQ